MPGAMNVSLPFELILRTDRLRCPFALESWVVLEPGGFMLFHDTRRLRDFANVAWVVQSFFEEVEAVYCNQAKNGRNWLNDLERGAMRFVAAGRSTLVAKTTWYKMIEMVRFADVSVERLNAIYNRDLNV
jgi:hypothetical protein